MSSRDAYNYCYNGALHRFYALRRGYLMNGTINCDSCFNYSYDEEYNSYECQVYLDEDEMGKFLSNSMNRCPHFQFNDEYKIVRKQM